MALKLTMTCVPYDRAQAVDQLLDYGHRQGFTPREFEPEEMFHPSTLET